MLSLFFIAMKTIKLIFDRDTLVRYSNYYFILHPRAHKQPIAQPYHESINVWMIMKRAMMNALKQKWKDFIVWFVRDQGYSNLRIQDCELIYTAYYPNHRRHDPDNSVPKFINDGLVESGFLVDDDSTHIRSLTLKCDVDTERPRTEIEVRIYQQDKKEK